jgi:DNA topoisomerase-1
MEDKLDDIANGARTYEKTLTEFYGPFHKEVLSKDKLAKATNLGLADKKFKCPKCGTTPMEIKLGKNGKFLSCSRYPDCEGALTLDGTEFKSDTPIGNDPTTGLPIFVLNGRFGPYVQLGVKPPKVKKVKGKKVPTSLKLRKAGKSEEVKSATIETKTSTEPASSNEPVAPITPVPPKLKMASIPKGVDPSKVTVADALKYLSLPRTLGVDPKTNLPVTASAGGFGLSLRDLFAAVPTVGKKDIERVTTTTIDSAPCGTVLGTTTTLTASIAKALSTERGALWVWLILFALILGLGFIMARRNRQTSLR